MRKKSDFVLVGGVWFGLTDLPVCRGESITLSTKHGELRQCFAVEDSEFQLHGKHATKLLPQGMEALFFSLLRLEDRVAEIEKKSSYKKKTLDCFWRTVHAFLRRAGSRFTFLIAGHPLSGKMDRSSRYGRSF